MIIEKQLHENWTMRTIGKDERLPAKVPGSVYADLLAGGLIPDPFYRDNELPVRELMNEDYEYTTAFDAPPELLARDRILLRCDGLDTLAEISLNGAEIGKADNMHRVWEFDLTGKLKNTGNILSVIFRSPTKYIKAMDKKSHWGGTDDAMRGFPHIRKAHCMFGWDWGPRLPDAGIWRPIKLIGIDKARITDVHIRQNHENGKVRLNTCVTIDVAGNSAGASRDYDLTVTITAPDGSSHQLGKNQTEYTIDKPELWWPHGYGGQPLYTVTVALCAGEARLDEWQRRIGLRVNTIRRVRDESWEHLRKASRQSPFPIPGIPQQKDEYGESFEQNCNGLSYFAMGADYIPEDNILSRVMPARTRALLEQCVAANFNSIRVWGGGYYPDDYFYDICDELGLVVWQDFMYACDVIGLEEKSFEENITQEAIDNIKRLRHHASLGLWCGNNENEGFMAFGVFGVTPYQKADYIKLFEYILPNLIQQYDPDSFYWPSSCSSGGSFDNPMSLERGDVHYWGVWHGNEPFSAYRNAYFRYASEFGFQALPSLKTIEAFTLPEDRNLFSYVMEVHQRNSSANGKIMNYLSANYLYPTSFDKLIYASQLLQADGIRYGVEHWRRYRGHCMGAVYWQLNDIWPVTSWASLDYYHRWKALHYYAKRFFAPLLLSCCEEGLITQNPYVNRESPDMEKSIRLSVANETREDRDVLVKWALRDAGALVVSSGEQGVHVPALTSVWLDKTEYPDADIYSQYASYELYENGAWVSSGATLFSVPKHFKFRDPQLSLKVAGDRITVSAKTFAQAVWIFNENDDLVLSDNYFDMNAGERTVSVVKGELKNLKVWSVFDIR